MIRSILTNSIYMLAYGIVAALIMSLALGILIKVWDWITPINEWDEIKKGNIAVAIVTSAVIVGFALVVGIAIWPGH
jgi:putative membrane protein